MQEETGATPDEVTRAFILVRDIFGFEALWAAIDALDNRVPRACSRRCSSRRGGWCCGPRSGSCAGAARSCPSRRSSRSSSPGSPPSARQLPAILSADRPRGVRGGRRAARGRRACRRSSPRAHGRARRALRGARRDRGRARRQGGRWKPSRGCYFALAGDLELRWFAERITALPTDTTWQALAQERACATTWRASNDRSPRRWRSSRRARRTPPR